MEVFGVNDLGPVNHRAEAKAKESSRAQPRDEAMYKPSGEGADIYTGVQGGIRVRIGTPLAEIQRVYIEQTLKKYGGNREEAAKALDLDKGTLTRKMKEYGL